MKVAVAVRIELRAAQLAQDVLDGCAVWRGMELAGWMRQGDNRERGSYPKDPSWQAGWLAAHIWGRRMQSLLYRRAVFLDKCC